MTVRARAFAVAEERPGVVGCGRLPDLFEVV